MANPASLTGLGSSLMMTLRACPARGQRLSSHNILIGFVRQEWQTGVMRNLFTLAYPRLSEKDTKFIEEFRRLHDGHHALVRAHFTMVFGCSGVDERAYLEHVREVARLSRPVPFVCRYAMLGADHEGGRAYVFLVPDEGYSGISRIHDALYRREMAAFLRLDIPYVPHITLGSSADRAAMKTRCDELNQSELSVHGSLEALTVVAQEDGSLVDVGSFPFKSGGA